ncbi:hypothetical protein ASC94_10435 [Massilia sp. Root418]|uniref:PAAR domain-containing protein n=1 Tax=Massilia sp. Root418 TaxID=1736532 RepID=UPI0006F58E8A|nr:PAAR domain-containing protein [Massilia sp. Root418]KQW97195.1 hypothetical protein ASC94_10435 [Massilia sp. Root418]
MARAVICKGDPTSHGGKVLEGNENATCLGKPIALKGHKTYCPLCKGQFPIAEGLGHHSFGGIGTVVEGMKTTCGATLLATQHVMTVDGTGGGASQAAATPAAAAPGAKEATYRGAFRAVDEHTGEPIAGLPYRIDLPDGSSLRGVTGADGRTEAIRHHDPATATLHWETEERGS